jgi:hypothetical protein
MKRPLLATLVLILCLCNCLTAQDIGSIGKSKPLTITGGVSLNQILYGVSGIKSRRDPYSYFASGNVNFSLYGWNVPLSFSLSNQGTSFQQPFNQYSLHPTYKSITAHAGYISMSYSPYTVSGHIFLGGAVDVAPEEGKWKVSALYGRFLRGVEEDTSKTNAVPTYRRMGYGVKAGYGVGGNSIDVTMFHAKDQINSIHYIIPDSAGILPQENLVASIAGSKTFLEHFVVKAEIASSAITRDTRTEESSQSKNVLSKTGFLYTPRLSSSYYKAIKGSLDYQFDAYSIGVGYERVDPEYRTLGAYFFNNDLESYTVNGAGSILEGKMSVAASAGLQHDNLDKSKISTMRRAVGSVNVNYAPSERLNLSASYSTFNTYTNIRSQFVDINELTPYDNLDTLKYTQLSKSATLSAMYALSNSKEKRQSINLNLSVQNAADKQGDVQQNSGTQFYNANAAYALNIAPKNMTVSVSFNGTFNESPGFETTTIGPTASVSKGFFEKRLRTTLSSSYNNTFNNGTSINTIINGRVGCTYSIQKKHNLNLGLVVVNRDSKSGTGTNGFTEFTGTLGYSYSFGSRQK